MIYFVAWLITMALYGFLFLAGAYFLCAVGVGLMIAVAVAIEFVVEVLRFVGTLFLALLDGISKKGVE